MVAISDLSIAVDGGRDNDGLGRAGLDALADEAWSCVEGGKEYVCPGDGSICGLGVKSLLADIASERGPVGIGAGRCACFWAIASFAFRRAAMRSVPGRGVDVGGVACVCVD